jgi:hypothetical protein
MDAQRFLPQYVRGLLHEIRFFVLAYPLSSRARPRVRTLRVVLEHQQLSRWAPPIMSRNAPHFAIVFAIVGGLQALFCRRERPGLQSWPGKGHLTALALRTPSKQAWLGLSAARQWMRSRGLYSRARTIERGA